MSADQFQHYAPKSYQKGWAPNGLVHVYEQRHRKLVCKAKSTKSTGGRPGLYYIPMAPPEQRNFMEDVFWKTVDQWGADGLALLRDRNPAQPKSRDLERLAIFINSFAFRNPRKIGEFQAQAKRDVLGGCLSSDYATHRLPHEPHTLGEFKAMLELPGLTELAAKYLRAAVTNGPIITQLLSMDWQVVTVTGAEPILTSDNPLICHKGLKEDDGAWILPLSPDEFFVAFNRGKIDMEKEIDAGIRAGRFVRAINEYVIRNRIECVYAVDDSQSDFVARHWALSEAA